MTTTVNKREITLRIAEQTGVTQLMARETVQEVINTIIQTLAESGRLELRDFGVFEVKHRAAYTARNPLTGEAVKVPPKEIVTFKPGKSVEEKVQKSFQRKRMIQK
jgi:nucleoid DNA-binding protein